MSRHQERRGKHSYTRIQCIKDVLMAIALAFVLALMLMMVVVAPTVSGKKIDDDDAGLGVGVGIGPGGDPFTTGMNDNVDDDKTDVDVLETLTEEQFLGKYKGKKPFVLKWKKNPLVNHKAFAIKSLLKTFRNAEFQVGTSRRITESGGRGTDRVRLGEFVSGSMQAEGWEDEDDMEYDDDDDDDEEQNDRPETLYIFDRDNVMTSKAGRLLTEGSVHVPSFLTDDFKTKYLIIGRKNSAVTLHQHEEAWAYLVSGTKQWYIFNASQMPSIEYPIMRSQRSWINELLPLIMKLPKSQQPIMYTQHAGELLYIPELWYHGTWVTSGCDQQYGLSVSLSFQRKLYDTDWGWSASNISSLMGNNNKESFLRAAQACENMLEDHGEHDAARYMHAVSLSRAEEYVQAFYSVKKAIQISPHRSDLYIVLSEILVGMKKPKASVKALKKALKFNPTHHGAMMVLAERYKSMGYVDEAVEILDALSEIDIDSGTRREIEFKLRELER